VFTNVSTENSSGLEQSLCWCSTVGSQLLRQTPEHPPTACSPSTQQQLQPSLCNSKFLPSFSDGYIPLGLESKISSSHCLSYQRISSTQHQKSPLTGPLATRKHSHRPLPINRDTLKLGPCICSIIQRYSSSPSEHSLENSSVALGFTESQNVRGWQGPLWVI